MTVPSRPGGVVSVGVLDYGSGNLHSVRQALLRLGASVVVTPDWDELQRCDGLVLPGVGAFAACMAGLRVHVPALADWAARRRPLLGICVGHQALFGLGREHGATTRGLGLLPGAVEQLRARRLPHMGWNTVDAPAGSAMFDGLGDQRFYFVHSYAVRAVGEQAPAGALVTWCSHEDDRFVAGVEAGPIWGTQFHPEKSGGAGARLLGNWLAYVAGATRNGATTEGGSL